VHLPFDDGPCPKPRLTHAVVSPARQFADEQTAAPPAGWRPAVVQFVLEYEAYLGRVLWRGESLPGLRESLVDELTFQRRRSCVNAAKRWRCATAKFSGAYGDRTRDLRLANTRIRAEVRSD
jgi:hypothetical protein